MRKNCIIFRNLRKDHRRIETKMGNDAVSSSIDTHSRVQNFVHATLQRAIVLCVAFHIGGTAGLHSRPRGMALSGVLVVLPPSAFRRFSACQTSANAQRLLVAAAFLQQALIMALPRPHFCRRNHRTRRLRIEFLPLLQQRHELPIVPH